MVPKALFFLLSSLLVLFSLTLITAKRPINPALLTGKLCKTVDDCNESGTIRQNFCNEKGQCECNFGYYPKTFGEKPHQITVCMEYKCNQTDQCPSIYGPDTECSMFNRCDCQRSFTYIPADRECQTNATKLQDKCTTTKDCGLGAVCGEASKCVCSVGNVKVNDYACDSYYCRNDQQCEQITPHSSCLKFTEIGQCRCQGIYQTNSFSTKCVRRGADRGDTCRQMLDCGTGATCASGKCLCIQGWTPSTENNIDCQQIKCREQSDCSGVDGNSYCDSKNTCQCNANFFVDPDTQKCYKFNTPNVLIMMAYIFGGALVAGLLTGIAVKVYLANKNRPSHHNNYYKN